MVDFAGLGRERTFLVGIVASIAILLTFVASGHASPNSSQGNERIFENNVPDHLPIKVKLKAEKESAVKDLTNNGWYRDFELEVTNVGDRNIYYLEFILELPEVKPFGPHMGFALRFGRIEFVDPKIRPTAQDTPLKPKQSVVISIPDDLRQNWQRGKGKGIVEEPTKLELWFQILNYDDGSGFRRDDGMPFPQKRDPAEVAKDFGRVCSCDFVDRSFCGGGNDPRNHTKQHERGPLHTIKGS